jgi:hypothetical protein
LNSELSLEQQFELVATSHVIADANLEELRELFLELYKTMMVRDNISKSLLAQHWGLADELG